MFRSNELSKLWCGIACLLFVSILGGCAVGLTNQPVASNIQAIGKPRVLLMQTQLIRGKDTYSMDLVADVSAERLIIVGSSLGVRLFTLSYDGVTVMEGLGRGLPFYISNRLVVDDVMLALTPMQALVANLPTDCSIFSESGLEKIYCGGKLTVSLRGWMTSNENTTVALQRFDPDYELNIVISEVQ